VAALRCTEGGGGPTHRDSYGVTADSRPCAQGTPPPRLARLGQRPLPGGGRLFVAHSFGQRLFGLAGIRCLPAGCALLIPRCDSVHTAWMRFPIDVVFLDADGAPIRVVSALRPWRMATCRSAVAVVETPAGGSRAFGYRAVEPVGRDGLTRKPGRLPLVKTPLPPFTFHGFGAVWPRARRKRVNREET